MKETLLELLCTPLSHVASPANPAELSQINSQIHQRLVRNRDGLIVLNSTAPFCANRKSCYLFAMFAGSNPGKHLNGP